MVRCTQIQHTLMGRPSDHLPAPPDLPSFRIESTPEERERDTIPASERHAGTGLIRHAVALEEGRLDADAARVVRRLERAGFQAYFVGGCVRDLLLGGTPKDYDIATSARPEDVRGLFRNCRVIGRRFRLAHVIFGSKIVEVATFRRSPQTELLEPDDVDGADDLLIRNDNVFGDAHEDAIRRDFTINALFYDLDRRQVLDWCGGMDDITRRTIHTIGEPIVRFREDPIRILRAIKFAARLDLGIEPDVYDAMVSCREELAKAARPRVFEEILRLLRGGAAHRSMWLFWEIGAMAILLPELAAFLDDHESTAGGAERFWGKLDAIDRHTREQGKALDDIVLWATLLSEPLEECVYGDQDRGDATADFLEPIVDRIAMPRRIADAIRRIRTMLPRLAQGKGGRLLKNEVARYALETLEIELAAKGETLDGLAKMREEALAFAPEVSVGSGRRMGRFRGGRARVPRP
jgi:poly(A) polymerase